MPILADVTRVAGLAPHHDDLGIVTRANVVGMDEDLAEAAGEGLLPRRVELLVAEELLLVAACFALEPRDGADKC